MANVSAMLEQLERELLGLNGKYRGAALREARAFGFFFGFVIGGIVVWLLLHVLKAMA